jgi:hypothetical protein
MTKVAQNVQVRLPEDLQQRIEKFRRLQHVEPTLSETVRYILERGMEIIEQGEMR